MNHISSLFDSCSSNSTLEAFAHGYGIALETADILLLNAIGHTMGNSVLIQGPNMIECSPAFDIATIAEGRALISGAIFSSIQGIISELDIARGSCATTDRRSVANRRKELATRHAQIERELNQLSEESARREASPFRYFLKGSGEFPYPPKIDASDTRDRLELEKTAVEREHVDTSILLHSGVIRDDPDWQGFLKAGSQSIDGRFVQIASADSLIRETSSTSNQLKPIVEMLRRSRGESPVGGFESFDNGTRASIHLTGTEQELRTLFRHSRLQNLGFFNSFLLVEADADQAPDGDAMERFKECELHDWVSDFFRIRAIGSQERLRLDSAGCKTYLDFREWIYAFVATLPQEHRTHFLRWPELMLQLALPIRAITADCEGNVLRLPHIERAISILQRHASRQAEILVKLTRKSIPIPSQLDDQIAGLVERLRVKGPHTRRQLVRRYHGQDYNVIDFRLAEAIRRGVIFQSDRRFHATGVSVNASTELEATEIGEGVA